MRPQLLAKAEAWNDVQAVLNGDLDEAFPVRHH